MFPKISINFIMSEESLINFGEKEEKQERISAHDLIRKIGELLKDDKIDEAIELTKELENRLRAKN